MRLILYGTNEKAGKLASLVLVSGQKAKHYDGNKMPRLDESVPLWRWWSHLEIVLFVWSYREKTLILFCFFLWRMTPTFSGSVCSDCSKQKQKNLSYHRLQNEGNLVDLKCLKRICSFSDRNKMFGVPGCLSLTRPSLRVFLFFFVS